MAKVVISKEVVERVRAALKERIGGGRNGLYPPHLDIVREASGLEFSAGDAETYGALLETICGATDDSQPVEQYNGALGVAQAFVSAHQGAVGQLQWNNNLAALYTNPGNVNGVRWCTGTMISSDLFLTAGHCFDQTGGFWNRPVDNATGVTISNAEIATNMHVNFNYQVDPAGNLRVEQSFAITALVEYRLGGLDFAIARLAGNPGAIWGITQVSTTDAAINDMLCIIGHPAGWPKRIEAGLCLNVAGSTIRYDDIDTLGGNSGSGILRAADGKLVGVHTNGGCNAAGTGSNFGVTISAIIAASATLRALLVPPTLKFIDDVRTVKFLDDGSTKFRDDQITLKFIDDINTLAVLDSTTTHPFLDSGGTSPVRDMGGTLKHIDDVKRPEYDKQFGDRKSPGADGMQLPIPLGPREFGRGGATPFILSTPHHSTAWQEQGARHASASAIAEVTAQYEHALAQLEAAMQQHVEQLSQMDGQYRLLLAEYEALARG